jgi:hypothetical protein
LAIDCVCEIDGIAGGGGDPLAGMVKGSEKEKDQGRDVILRLGGSGL